MSIRVNYTVSLTWHKATNRWFPLLTIIPMSLCIPIICTRRSTLSELSAFRRWSLWRESSPKHHQVIARNTKVGPFGYWNWNLWFWGIPHLKKLPFVRINIFVCHGLSETRVPRIRLSSFSQRKCPCMKISFSDTLYWKVSAFTKWAMNNICIPSNSNRW